MEWKVECGNCDTGLPYGSDIEMKAWMEAIEVFEGRKSDAKVSLLIEF